MYPIITIGTFEISFYVMLRLTAIALLLVWVTLRLRRSQLPVTLRMFFLDGLPWLIVGLVVGGAVENGVPLPVAWAVRGVSPLPEWWGNSRWLGALGGASLMGYLYCRRRELPVGQAFDLFAVPLAVAVARVDCLLNGCCYFRTPLVLLGDLPGDPLVGFDGRCGFVSRLESVAPGVLFTHTHPALI